MTILAFLERHYRHFNAATVVEATDGYARHLESGGKMMVTLAGAMSTAELGISLAEMIRRENVHAITCTGANLEEDLFNLVAHEQYERISRWRNLTTADEKTLETRGLNRVTDTCIPEEAAIRAIARPLLELWQATDRLGERRFPH
ncbi:MAG: deoxyhypusine synthase family protein, partial [Thermoanaerobaculia bacterium]